MNPTAILILQALLDHHHHACQPGRAINECVITYGDLCQLAGLPGIAHPIGPFLQEVAVWCDHNHVPPLNPLAVNAGTGIPGDGYDDAPGCHIENWEDEARACIDFPNYPAHVNQNA